MSFCHHVVIHVHHETLRYHAGCVVGSALAISGDESSSRRAETAESASSRRYASRRFSRSDCRRSSPERRMPRYRLGHSGLSPLSPWALILPSPLILPPPLIATHSHGSFTAKTSVSNYAGTTPTSSGALGPDITPLTPCRDCRIPSSQTAMPTLPS